MRNQIQQICSALLLVTVLSAPVVALAGPGGTGGGNVCDLSNGKLQLLELAGRSTDYSAADQLPYSTPSIDAANLDFLPVRNLRSYELAQRMITSHSQSAPTAMKTVGEALSSIVFEMTGKVLFAPIRASHLERCATGKVFASAFYSPGGFALVSIPSFNRMDLESQAGLFVHESLRRVQLSYRRLGNDSQLEDLTLKILSTENTNLDEDDFFKSAVPVPVLAESNFVFGRYCDNRNPSYDKDIAEKIKGFCSLESSWPLRISSDVVANEARSALTALKIRSSDLTHCSAEFLSDRAVGCFFADILKRTTDEGVRVSSDNLVQFMNTVDSPRYSSLPDSLKPRMALSYDELVRLRNLSSKNRTHLEERDFQTLVALANSRLNSKRSISPI